MALAGEAAGGEVIECGECESDEGRRLNKLRPLNGEAESRCAERGGKPGRPGKL